MSVDSIVSTKKSGVARIRNTIKKYRKVIFPLALGALFVMVPLLIIELKNAPEAQAGWWDESWLYRQRIEVTYTGSETLTEYQVFVENIDTATLISNGKMQSDCDDIRFTNTNGLRLDYFIVANSCNTSDTDIFVKTDLIDGSDIEIYMYYGNASASQGHNEIATFSYKEEKQIAYVLGDNVTNTEWNGTANIYSLMDGNSITHNSTTVQLDFNEQDTTSITSSQFGVISAKGLFYMADPGFVVDIVTPISWAGTEFLGRTADNNRDAFWIMSPWGTASVSVYEAGTNVTDADCGGTGGSVSIGTSGGLIDCGASLTNDVAFRITSDIPVIITNAERRTTNTDQEIIPLYPSRDSDEALYGYASTDAYVSSGPNGLDYSYIHDDTATSTTGTLAANSILNIASGAGRFNDTSGPYRIQSTTSGDTFNTSQEGDGAGGDATTFVPRTEFGTIFGANLVVETISPLSDQASTCTTYDNNTIKDTATLASSNTLVFGPQTDVFGMNGTADYITNPWYVVCNKPVYAFWNDGSSREKNVFTWPMMRQFTYPTPTPQTPDTEEVGPGPVGWWKMDEGTNNTCENGTDDVCDSASYGNDGTNTATWTEPDLCIFSHCLSFDGTDDVVTIANNSSIDFDIGLDSGVSASFWVKVNSDGEGSAGEIFEKGTHFRCQTDGETAGAVDLECSIDLTGTDPTATASGALKIGRWHHVSVTYADDGDDDLLIYVDGELKATGAGNGGPAGSDTSSILIGGSTANNFHGFIDEFKLYPYERTAAEVKTDYIVGASNSGSTVGVSTDIKSYLSNGLVGYWKLNESSGNAIDSSGIGTTLTNNNTTSFSNAKFGNGAEFNGTTQYFEAPDNATLSITGNLSLSAWIEPDDTTGQQNIIGKWDGTNNSYLLALNGDELVMYIDSASNYETTTAANIAANTLTHVAGTYDQTSQTVKLYVNGVLESSTTSGTIPSSIGDDAGEIVIGADDSAANYFDGHIDDTRIYNRTLSYSHINNLYNWGPGPVAYYPFDENKGTSTAYDKSGNSYDATLTSIVEADWVPGKLGSALQFDGSSDYATASTENGDFSSNNYSVSAWIYRETDSGGIEAIIDNRDADNDGWSLQINASDTVTCSYNSTDSTSTTTISLNTWYHVACTSSGTTQNLYINSIEEDSDAITGNISETTDIRISTQSYGTSQKFAGLIDEVRIYNYNRNANQIVEDMNGGHPAGGSPIGSPVLHLKFDDLHGDTANDSSPQSNTGDLAGSGTTCPQAGDSACPSWTTNGKLGGALDFEIADTTDDYVSVPSDGSLDLEDQATVSAWVKWESFSSWETIFHNGTGAWGTGIWLANSGQTIRCSFDGLSDEYDDFTYNLVVDTWYHIACVYNGSEGKVYINGIEEHSWAATGDIINQGPVNIGRTESPQYFMDGVLDEIKVYPTALTPEQIKIDYNFGSNINVALGSDGAADLEDGTYSSSLVGYWSLNENVDNTCSGGTNDACDTSTNSNDGLNTNSPVWAPGKYGSALEFNGSNQYVDIGTGPSTVRTITFWAYPETTTEYFINLTSTTDYISSSSGTIGMTGDASETIYVNGIPSTTIVADEWQHIAVITSTTENASNFDIGRTQDTNYMEGRIDEVKLFSTALSAGQIAYEYSRGKPLGWWRFDECEGETLHDASGNSLDGTWSGSSGSNTSAGVCTSGAGDEAWANGSEGKINASLEFDDTDDTVTVSDNNALDLTSGLTITAWVKTDVSEANNVVVSKGASYEVGINADGDITWDGTSSQDDGSSAVTSGVWHFIAVTNDDTTVTYYVDGKQTGTDSSGVAADNSTSLLIGSDGTNYFDGQIDDVQIFGYELSDKEIAKVYNQGAARFGN